MEFGSVMPFWAILYCGILLANGLLTIMISFDKSLIYQLSQSASTLFAILFFMFYYGVISKPDSITPMLLMLAWMLYQEIWGNRVVYQKLFQDFIPPHDRATTINYIITVTLLFLTPFFYIVTKLLISY